MLSGISWEMLANTGWSSIVLRHFSTFFVVVGISTVLFEPLDAWGGYCPMVRRLVPGPFFSWRP